MRILINSHDLTGLGGVQTFVRDLARQLLRWGHEPVVHSPWLGAVANDLRAWTIPVTSDLRTIKLPPDVIIGNYHLGTMTALQQFPQVPAVFVCHGTQASVPRAPRIRRYVAVDDACWSHMVYESGIEPERVEIVLNSVDLARFQARPALPATPRRALLFGNEFAGQGPWRAILAACKTEGIETEVVGNGAGRQETHPEKALLDYDVVFARGRSALEAMATGAATILAGPNRMGTLVTPEEVARYRTQNFGRRVMTTPIDAAAVRRELGRYGAADAAEVCRMIRDSASLDLAAGQFVRLAEEAVADAEPFDVARESAAMAAYLSSLEADPMQRMYRLHLWATRVPFVGRLAAWTGRRLMRALRF
ncbi:MAG TPA: glycosyltransferase [Thermoanaerobaculia bacterium]